MPTPERIEDYPEKERVRARAIDRMCREIWKAETEDLQGRMLAIDRVATTHAADRKLVGSQIVRVGIAAFHVVEEDFLVHGDFEFFAGGAADVLELSCAFNKNETGRIARHLARLL